MSGPPVRRARARHRWPGRGRARSRPPRRRRAASPRRSEGRWSRRPRDRSREPGRWPGRGRRGRARRRRPGRRPGPRPGRPRCPCRTSSAPPRCGAAGSDRPVLRADEDEAVGRAQPAGEALGLPRDGAGRAIEGANDPVARGDVDPPAVHRERRHDELAQERLPRRRHGEEGRPGRRATTRAAGQDQCGEEGGERVAGRRDTTAGVYTEGDRRPGRARRGGYNPASQGSPWRERPSSSSISGRSTRSSSRGGCASCRSTPRSCLRAPAADALAARRPRGIVLSGGPDSVAPAGRSPLRPAALRARGAGAGHLLRHAAHGQVLGGEVKRSGHREYGQAIFSPKPGGTLFRGPAPAQPGLDEPRRRRAPGPGGFRVVGAHRDERGRRHRGPGAPALRHAVPPRGRPHRGGHRSSRNFLDVCGCRRDWNAALVRRGGDRARPGAGGPKGRVICALSGGVDSAVAALLVHRAIGEQLTCVFVDNGLLRKDEATQVRRRFAERLRLKVVFVDASRRFLKKLARRRPTPSASGRSSATSSSRSSRPRCARRARPSSSPRARSTPT